MRRPCRFWFVIFVVLAGSRLRVAVLHFCQVEEKPQEAVVEEKPHEKAVPFLVCDFCCFSWF